MSAKGDQVLRVNEVVKMGKYSSMGQLDLTEEKWPMPRIWGDCKKQQLENQEHKTEGRAKGEDLTS